MEQRSQQSADVLIQAAESLFRLGRLFGRIGVPTETMRAPRNIELSRILIVQAIEKVQAEGKQEATVGAIAQQLAVEPSTASRLVADAVKDGYLVRGTSSTDSRRVHLTLTDAGHKLAQDAQAYQTAVFRQVTSNWAEHERAEFARLFVLFAEATTVLVQSQTAHETNKR